MSWLCYVPKSETVLKLERKLLRCLNNYMHTVQYERSHMTMKCRIWVTRDSKMSELDKAD